MRIVIMSSPVAPLGAGRTGGVTLHVKNTAAALQLKGHDVEVIAPAGSRLAELTVHEVVGALQPTSATKEVAALYAIPENGVLAAMWHAAVARQSACDAILNMAHDWLPYYLTGFFTTPVLHLVNMADVNAPTTAEIARVSRTFVARVAVMTTSQASRLGGLQDPVVVGFGLDLSAYDYNPRGGGLAWAGRISPEKGLEDAIAVARRLGERLAVAGAVDDEAHWRSLQEAHGDVIDYRGFLAPCPLQQFYGSARVLLQTQKWHEAFGIVTAEAMACGTPVVAYARGANGELVRNGVSGTVVAADDITAAATAVTEIGKLDRARCRQYAETHFSLAGYGDRLSAWLDRALAAS